MMPNDHDEALIQTIVQILLTPPSQRGYAGPMAKTFVGSRVRQLRGERGFSQAALAQMLDISPSYLNQIEHDVRPLTVAVLLRITEVFGVDATFFASQDDTRLLAELREVTLDHDLGVEVDQSELADVVSSHPALARALVNLHRRYRLTTTQLAAATEDRFSDGSGSGSITMPHEEVRDYFYERQNYLHELDTAAEELTVRMRMHRADLVRDLRSDGHEINYVDTGGGLGIDYQKPSTKFAADVAEYARAVSNPLRGLNLHLLLEPGRSIVGPAGVLITSVIYKKENDGKRFLVVDAAMNDLIRPALYGAYHQIVPIIQSKESAATKEFVDVVGPVCESGDFFARDRELPRVEEGDLLAILDAGAYGMALASNYNTRPRPAEILVSGKSAKVIRRREKARELYAAEL